MSSASKYHISLQEKVHSTCTNTDLPAHIEMQISICFFLNAVYDNVKIQEITILYHSLENKPGADFPSKVRSYL